MTKKLSRAEALLLKITGDPTVFTPENITVAEELRRLGLITFSRNMDSSQAGEVVLEIICRLTARGKEVQERLREEGRPG